MNLKASKAGYMGGSGGKEKKGEMMSLFYNLKRNNESHSAQHVEARQKPEKKMLKVNSTIHTNTDLGNSSNRPS